MCIENQALEYQITATIDFYKILYWLLWLQSEAYRKKNDRIRIKLLTQDKVS